MLDFDVRQELEQFSWHRARWTSNKLISASPFRYDRNPSFMVRLESDGHYPAGSWCDSGATDPEWTSGGIVKLLAFLRNETYDDTRDYLQIKYAPINNDVFTLDMSKTNICLKTSKQKFTLDISILNDFRYRHPYLSGRGISEDVQRKMRIGYDKISKAVTIPWFTPNGLLANVKYRKTDSKVFWYQRGGMPLRELVYGIEAIYKERCRQAVLVEGEIDAMYCMTAGWPAIAIGGSAFTDEKADLIARSPIERLIIATDNDAVGCKIRQDVVRKLCSSMEIRHLKLPKEYKDVNEVPNTDDLKRYLEQCVRSNELNLQIT